jgi:hypothetical protein
MLELPAGADNPRGSDVARLRVPQADGRGMLMSKGVGAAAILLLALLSGPALRPERVSAQAPAAKQIPRMAGGRPNLQGIWQVRNRAGYNLEDHHARLGMPATFSVVEGGKIPYQDWALKKREANFANREKEDPFRQCYMPGVPRIMYIDFPFQVFQSNAHVAMTFEWTNVHRLIYTNGSKPAQGIEFWMGDSRGRWEGDVLVVEVTNHNDKTWFDMAGNFHSEALKVTERYPMIDADTIRYEATMEDPKVFTRPWKISMPIYRVKDMPRLLEYQCVAEKEEADGTFHREPRTWFPR